MTSPVKRWTVRVNFLNVAQFHTLEEANSLAIELCRHRELARNGRGELSVMVFDGSGMFSLTKYLYSPGDIPGRVLRRTPGPIDHNGWEICFKEI